MVGWVGPAGLHHHSSPVCNALCQENGNGSHHDGNDMEHDLNVGMSYGWVVEFGLLGE